jgi:pyruvate dehydrogenase E2 component (dihydrolipoamide acetyltransferase)
MEKIYTVTLPDIGEGVVEGEVVQWLKNIGDKVVQDEPIVVVMTDKATVELPTPYPGILAKQYYQPGELARLGKGLYDLSVDNSLELPVQKQSALGQVSAPKETRQKSCPAQTALESKNSIRAARGELERSAALPYVRKFAKELGVEINSVTGSGPQGRVEVSDLAAALRGVPTSAAAMSTSSLMPREGEKREPLIGIRNLMAKKMTESKRHIPHFSYFEQLDATRLIQLKQHFQRAAEKEQIGVTYMPFFIRALSLTLQRFPKVNSSYDENSNELVIYPYHNIGIAVTTPLGLIVPVLKGVEKMSLEQIVRAYWDLRCQIKANKLHQSDMSGSTITISNFGGLQGGGLFATPIINHPEAAILAVGRVSTKPMIKNGIVVACEALNLSWSFDHRLVDGDLASNLSAVFSGLLENPAQLL